MTHRPKVAVIVGPTASGKTGTAISLAREFGAEIISADAVAVYRGFDIGSAKPSLEERRAVSHHLIDVADPEEDYTAARFADQAAKAIQEILARNRKVVVAGGTGLYVKALLKGLFKAPPVDPDLREELNQRFEADPDALFQRLSTVDPATASKVQPRDGVRIVRALEVFLQTGRTISSLQQEHRFKARPYNSLSLGLRVDRETLAKRIQKRTRVMLEQGLLDEVRGLLQKGVPADCKPMRSIGYLQALSYLRGEMGIDETAERIMVETKRLAKRQMTWFRADPELQWLPGDDPQAFAQAVKAFWEG